MTKFWKECTLQNMKIDWIQKSCYFYRLSTGSYQDFSPQLSYFCISDYNAKLIFTINFFYMKYPSIVSEEKLYINDLII